MFREAPYTAPKACYLKLYHMEDRDAEQGQDAQWPPVFFPSTQGRERLGLQERLEELLIPGIWDTWG